MRALFVSDLHLTDRPLDAYRWEIFPQLRDLSNEHGINDLFILGDLTEFKDYHSSRLVNRLVDALYQLRKDSRIAEVFVLKGNHDGLDPALPYFKFLRKLPWCRFYTEPEWLERGQDSVLLLPHTRNPEEDWEGLELGQASHIFFHGTVTGAVSESGQKLEGLSVDWFKGLRSCILGGDIHVPQTVARTIEYIGAPYPIRFGDDFKPRALLLDGEKRISLPLENIRKVTVRCNAQSLGDDFDTLRRGDQVKVLIELRDSELGEFHEIKKAVANAVDLAGAVLCKTQLVKKAESIKPKLGKKVGKTTRTPKEELSAFCAKNTVTPFYQQLAEDLLEGEG